MKVFVAGATGVIGRPLVSRLVGAGHTVTALARSSEGARAVRTLGAEPAQADALDARSLTREVLRARPDVVVNQLTSIPRRLHPRRIRAQMAPTNALRIDATRTLVSAAARAGSTRVVSQSIAFVYDPTRTGLATEGEPLFLSAPASYRDLVVAVDVSERTVLADEGVHGVVLRYGLLYGPGTVYAADGDFTERVRRRAVPVVGRGTGVTSFVHVEDAAAATVLAVEGRGHGVYNVVDGEPAPVRAWLGRYAELLGAPAPRRVPRLLGRLAAGPYGVYFMAEMRGASNARAKQELGWTLRFPSWREGFAAELSPSGVASDPGP